jgi:hypothetical protein
MMTAKIRWTNEEKEKVLDKATEYYRLRALSPYDAIKQAQTMVLTDRNRHRAFNSHSSCYDLTNEVKKRAAYVKPLAKETETEPEPEVTVEPAQESSIDELINTIARRIALIVKDNVKLVVKELEHEFRLTKHDPTYNGDNFHKPRIVVIGLLNAQTHMIESEYGHKHDFRFVDASKSVNEKSVINADAYLIMKNFVNHSIYGIYQQFSNHVLIDGGMSALRAWLNTKGAEL